MTDAATGQAQSFHRIPRDGRENIKQPEVDLMEPETGLMGKSTVVGLRVEITLFVKCCDGHRNYLQISTKLITTTAMKLWLDIDLRILFNN